MKSPFILAAMMLASPAMAGESILYWRPPTPLELLTIQVRDLKNEIAALKQSKQAPALPSEALAKEGGAPVVKAKPKACPMLKARQKCKPGRRQSPKHNCKCGVWK